MARLAPRFLNIFLFATWILLATAWASDLHSKKQPASMIIGYNSSVPDYSNPGKFDLPIVNEMIHALPVQGLRFPGGTIANYFDWETMQVNESWLVADRRDRIVRSFRKFRERLHGKTVTLSLESFSALVKRHDIAPFIVLNLYRTNFDQIKQAVETVKQSLGGDHVIRWELGNELSIFFYNKKGWGIDVYARKARQIARYIKSRYPNDLIGVVGGEYIPSRVFKRNQGAAAIQISNDWNGHLASEDWFDAVIYHPYVFVHSPRLWSAEGLAKSPQELSEKRSAWIEKKVAEIPSAYSRAHSKFFGNTSVWLTEVGIEGLELNDAIQDDIHRAGLMQVVYWLEWIRSGLPVDVYLFHTLAHGKAQSGFAPVDEYLRYSPQGVSQVLIGRFNKQIRKAIMVDVSVNSDGIYMAKAKGGGVPVLLINTTVREAVIDSTVTGPCDILVHDREVSRSALHRRVATVSELKRTVYDCSRITLSPESTVLLERKR